MTLDEETSERYAVIAEYLRRAGTPIPTNDLWIAASAMQHGLKILTTDRHFLHISQVLTEFMRPPFATRAKSASRGQHTKGWAHAVRSYVALTL